MAENTSPKISIIVPVYKVEQYLRRCLDSIASQTFTDWECILIDDGSPDNSGAICDAYAARDARFRVIHQENKCLGHKRMFFSFSFATFLFDVLYPAYRFSKRVLYFFSLYVLNRIVAFVPCNTFRKACYRICGMKIGKGSVVCACAVVTKNVPDYTVVAGIPAKVIGTRNQDLDYVCKPDKWFM